MATYDAWNDAWGDSWGVSWTHTTGSTPAPGDAFQCGVFDPVAFDTNCPPDTSGGVKRVEREIIRLRDLAQDRESTADYIKRRLGLLNEKTGEKNEEKRVEYRVSGQDEVRKLAEIAARNMEIERQEELRIIKQNNMVIAMIIAGSQW